MTEDRLDIAEDSNRRALLGLLLPAAAGLILPVRVGVARGPNGALAPIAYADLPTGSSGHWDSGAGTTITIDRALTVSGLLIASAANSLLVSGGSSVAITFGSGTGSATDVGLRKYASGQLALVLGDNSNVGALYMGALTAVAGAFSGLLTASARVASADDIYFTSTDHGLRVNTSDASDNQRLFVAGGGALSSTRGAYLEVRGNEYSATGGEVHLVGGNVSTGALRFWTADTERLTIAFGGGTTASGLLTASAGILSNGDIVASHAGSTRILLASTDAATNAKKWRMYSTAAGTLVIDALNDAENAANSALTITRSGATPTALCVATDIDFCPTGSRRCGWRATADDTLKWYDSGGTNRLVVKYADGHPIIGLDTENAQLAVGDPTNGGYVLLNGTNNGGGEAGDVLITGRSGGSAGVGDVKIRTSADGSSATTLATFKADGTLNVGAPSGGTTGAGKINVAGDVYKNGAGYTNPDYVFELAYEGVARSPAPGGYALQTLDETERFTREHLHLPGISREASGMFARADMLLEKVEELYLHTFAQQREIQALKNQVQQLMTQNRVLLGQPVGASANH